MTTATKPKATALGDEYIDALIAEDIEAQRNEHDWHAHRERIQGRLRPLIAEGTAFEGQAGTAGWEQRKGSIEYKAALEHMVRQLRDMLSVGGLTVDALAVAGLIEGVTDDIDYFRKPESASFYVRPALKPAPIQEEKD